MPFHHQKPINGPLAAMAILLLYFLPLKNRHYGIYLPFGYNNMSSNGYSFCMEIAYSSINQEDHPVTFSLKFGYHFNTK